MFKMLYSSTLTFTFLTGHPTDALPSRNVIPYYEMPIYRTVGSETLPSRKLTVDNGGKFQVLLHMKLKQIQFSLI
jgi:hypothetical protein